MSSPDGSTIILSRWLRLLIAYIYIGYVNITHTTMRVDLSPRLGGTHVCPPNRGERSTASRVANQPPTTVLLSFTFILPPRRSGVRSHSKCGTES